MSLDAVDLKAAAIFLLPLLISSVGLYFYFNDSLQNYGLAIGQNNPAICARISDGYIKDECYFQMAILTRNPLQCKLIKNPRREVDCIFSESSFKTGLRVSTDVRFLLIILLSAFFYLVTFVPAKGRDAKIVLQLKIIKYFAYSLIAVSVLLVIFFRDTIAQVALGIALYYFADMASMFFLFFIASSILAIAFDWLFNGIPPIAWKPKAKK